MRTKGEVGPGEVDAVELERIVGVALRKRWEKMGEKMRVESGTSFPTLLPLFVFRTLILSP